MIEVGEDGQQQQQQQTKTEKEKKKRHGARNQNRHKEFVKWLLKTFPSELQSSSTTSEGQPPYHHHVLDVAGGKGETAARLCMCHNQRVVMVDPRPADVVDCFLKQVLPKIPNKWQKRLEQRQQQYQQEQELKREQQEQEQDQSSSSSSLLKRSDCVVTDLVEKRFRQIVSPLDDTALESSDELQNAVRNSSLIIGLHADGATEAIVDAALCYHKPFVVVPCCVFPNFFQHRFIAVDDHIDVTSNSATLTATTTTTRTTKRQIPVRTHEQFCQFLVQKDPRFKMEQLPFEGRNIAIYWDGK